MVSDSSQNGRNDGHVHQEHRQLQDAHCMGGKRGKLFKFSMLSLITRSNLPVAGHSPCFVSVMQFQRSNKIKTDQPVTSRMSINF